MPTAPRRGSALPWLIVGGAVLVVMMAAVVGLGVWSASGGDQNADGGVTGGAGLEGLQTFDDLPKEHVETGVSVEYDQFPPVGGEHYSFWQNCGVYDEPVLTEAAVHSLEHGAVWLTYDPALDPAGVEELAAYHEPGSYVIVSPMEGLPSPVVASAWGARIELEGPEDPRLTTFLREYEQSPDAPEPGGPCSGAYDGTQAEFDAQGPGGVDARMK